MSTFIGLDFETSGLDANRHLPIQLGLADENGEGFNHLIGGWNWDSSPWTEDFPNRPFGGWDKRAEEVHGIAKDDLRSAPTVEMVDILASAWIQERSGRPEQTHAVGWNVASFDFVFLRKWFPVTTRSLSYRSVDLNAVVFTIVEAGLDSPWGEPWTYHSLKEEVNNYAAVDVYDQTGLDIDMAHDAGYDALTARISFDILAGILRGKQ